MTHNDTTYGNVLLDDVTGKGICVIDLDIVMPGLAFTLRSFQKLSRKKNNSTQAIHKWTVVDLALPEIEDCRFNYTTSEE
jgi:hypothetical protein